MPFKDPLKEALRGFGPLVHRGIDHPRSPLGGRPGAAGERGASWIASEGWLLAFRIWGLG